jgi:hypothetical protein
MLRQLPALETLVPPNLSTSQGCAESRFIEEDICFQFRKAERAQRQYEAIV